MEENDIKDYCLVCGIELDFIPSEDGGFCSIECNDIWYETGGVIPPNKALNSDP